MSDQKEKAQDESDEGSEGARQEASTRKPKTTIGESSDKERGTASDFFPQLAIDVESRSERYLTLLSPSSPLYRR